jgi:hypothetical protein
MVIAQEREFVLVTDQRQQQPSGTQLVERDVRQRDVLFHLRCPR